MAEVYVHYLQADDSGPIVSRAPKAGISPVSGRAGLRWMESRYKIACRPGVSLAEAVHATGERGPVTCPACVAIVRQIEEEEAAHRESLMAQSSLSGIPNTPLQPPEDCCP